MDQDAVIIEEYKSLRQEMISLQGWRLTILAFTAAGMSSIFALSLKSIIEANGTINNTVISIAITSLYVLLIPSIFLMRSTQQQLKRVANFIRCRVETKLAGLEWETDSHNARSGATERGGVRGIAMVYIGFTFLPLTILLFLTTSICDKVFIIPTITFALSIYLSLDLRYAFSNGWKSTTWLTLKADEE